MKIIYGIEKIGKFSKPVIALGVFDGVHLGHKHILRAAVKKAREINGTSVVVTFYPHPQKEQSLYSLEHRLRLIAAIGIDACIVINFSPAFAKIKAEDFIRKMICGRIGAAFIFVGKNFRFGYRAAGSRRLLENLARECGYKLKVFAAIKTNRRLISSTRIRRLITMGRLSTAQKLLTRPVTVLGTVVKGISLARKIGFPTANINPHHEILPPSGVYAVKVFFEGKNFNGVCNIGRKPTVTAGRKDKHVEVYIFNFNRNIYGKDLEIRFIKKIREEVEFPTLKHLACQIAKDVKKAKIILSA
ncbi:MAG: riboflavin biosynthesis protein RibF [Candidatus Omnitrophota bacterium]